MLAIYVAAVVIVTLQHLSFGETGYNVLRIYRTAALDLLDGRNIYRVHTAPPLDHFRYSPTFALAFLPLAAVPIGAALMLWNALNALGLYAAIDRLLPTGQARIAQLLVLGDLVRSMQNSQSNGLVAALMLMAFIAYRQSRAGTAAWAVASGAAIKIFPAGMGVFAVLDRRPRRAVGWLVVAGAVLVAAPALLVGPGMLLRQYQWWLGLEAAETVKPMYALMDLADAWTGHYWPRWPFQLAGLAALLGAVWYRRDAWQDDGFRLRLLGTVLVFSVLFNHGAESPSYVIASTGIAAWWVATPRSRLHNVVLLLYLLLVVVGRSDLTPRTFRIEVLDQARVIVIPLLLAWLAMTYELLRWRGVAGAEPARAR